MRVKTHKQYEKTWAKLSSKQQRNALTCLKRFLIDPQSPRLRIHRLKGEFYPQYSISAGGDLRIHFLQVDADTIVLMLIGTHSQLYG